MSNISDAQKSEKENRMLTKFPSLYVNRQINKAYGTDFEKWFNDRFFGRSLLLDIFHSVIYHTNSIYQNNKAIYIKENGWMFNLPLLAKNYNKTQLSEIKNNLHKFSEFLKQNNIKLYLLITPKKESIYSDLLESYGYNYNADNIIQRKYHSLFDGYNVTYPYKELKSASKKDYVFFKQSHHWTDWGAYIGYQALMKNIVKDFHDIPIISLENFKTYNNLLIRDEWDRTFHNGHTINLLGLSKYQDEILKTHYIYYTPLSDKLPEISISKYTKFFSNSEGKYRLFLIGNSQNENLLNFLPYSFNEINYLRLNKGQLPSSEQFKFMKHYKNLLLDFSPDIVVICISAEIMHEFINFYKE